MTEWEYHTEDTLPGQGPPLACMAELGNKGWELAAVVTKPGYDVYIFKREIERPLPPRPDWMYP